MGLDDVRLLAERERELIKLKDNYEETMARMRDKRAAVEANIAKLRDEAGSSMIEINRLRSLIENNKRVMDETESARTRLVK
jgi:cell division protein FtsB